MRMRRGERVVLGLPVVLFLGGWSSCGLGTGDPYDADPNIVDLNVPAYVQDYAISYCGVASIKMWAAFDGNSYSQSAIAASIGASAYSAEQLEFTRSGVSIFTDSADAFLDYCNASGPDCMDFFAQQVASINSHRPFIVEFRPWHRAIVRGGRWTYNRATGRRIWDYTYYNDPQDGLKKQLVGSAWNDKVVAHIVSSAAIINWQTGEALYAGSVWLRGAGGRLEKPTF